MAKDSERSSHGGRRKGAGRPLRGDKPLNLKRVIVFDESSIAKLDAIADSLNLNRSATIRHLIDSAEDPR